MAEGRVGGREDGTRHSGKSDGVLRKGIDSKYAFIQRHRRVWHATGAYERKLATLARVPLLIIDDFGLKPLRAPADEDLHDLIAERYERVATIVTSNLDFDELDQAFAVNRLLASATIDRLRHNAYCLELDGPSNRDPKVGPAPKKSPPKPSTNSAK